MISNTIPTGRLFVGFWCREVQSFRTGKARQVKSNHRTCRNYHVDILVSLVGHASLDQGESRQPENLEEREPSDPSFVHLIIPIILSQAPILILSRSALADCHRIAQFPYKKPMAPKPCSSARESSSSTTRPTDQPTSPSSPFSTLTTRPPRQDNLLTMILNHSRRLDRSIQIKEYTTYQLLSILEIRIPSH